jgi:integrase
VPSPKGGEERAFDLPLSGALIGLVRRRIEENRVTHPDSPWLFPSDSASGHVAEVRVDALGGLVGHALRHLYATLALEAGVPIADSSSYSTTPSAAAASLWATSIPRSITYAGGKRRQRLEFYQPLVLDLYTVDEMGLTLVTETQQ